MTSSRAAAADHKPGYDDVRYYAIHITVSQFLDKPRDASATVARSFNCEFAAISSYSLYLRNGARYSQSYYKM